MADHKKKGAISAQWQQEDKWGKRRAAGKAKAIAARRDKMPGTGATKNASETERLFRDGWVSLGKSRSLTYFATTWPLDRCAIRKGGWVLWSIE